MNKFLCLVALLLLPLAVTFAQHNHRCGVGVEDGALIKQRMMDNRARFPEHTLHQYRSPNTITYIPLGITIVGNSSGQGYASIEQILAMVCDLNVDYLDQNIQFYIKDTVRYMKNNNIYNDASTFQSTLAMSTNKKPNALNIYISLTVNNQVASFYNPGGDFVFLMNSMADGSSNTATHECGHFFSLNHTFYGWEGTSYHTSYQNVNAPNSVGGEQVEKVARTGSGSNCMTAADGFCDTEADYISDRWPCPYVGQGNWIAHDPTGAVTNPDETLYMSYYYDECVTRFTPQQKVAIASDVASRGWSNLAAPTPMTTMSSTGLTAVSPINSQLVHVDGTNSVTLQWNPVTDATGYVVTLNRTLAGTFINNVFTTVVYNTNSYTFSSSELVLPTGNQQLEHTWKVTPFNGYSTCAAPSSGFVFKATAQPVVGVEHLATAEADMAIMPNPVKNQEMVLAVSTENAFEGTVRLYSLDGKTVANFHNQQFTKGSNQLLLDVSNLSNGVYLAALITDKGTIARKFVVER